MIPLGFAGYSGSGKTTLIERLIPLLTGQGLRVSVIKHAHHDCDIDRPGKDSYRHREAGAAEVLITSGGRWALMRELRGDQEPCLEEHLARLSPCDLVLVEGYKHAAIPKIEVHRHATGASLLWRHDRNVIALASDARTGIDIGCRIPWLDLNDPGEVVAFILAFTARACRGHSLRRRALASAG